MPKPSNLTMCSFCGKSHDDVRKLIQGPGVYICDACIAVCARILRKELGPDFTKEDKKLLKRWANSFGNLSPEARDFGFGRLHELKTLLSEKKISKGVYRESLERILTDVLGDADLEEQAKSLLSRNVNALIEREK